MFSARCFKPDQEFTRKTIVDSIPPTNPFLKELFQSISQDEKINLSVLIIAKKKSKVLFLKF
jgi:hypothetical protein